MHAEGGRCTGHRYAIGSSNTAPLSEAWWRRGARRRLGDGQGVQIGGSGAAAAVKKYDKQIEAGTASRKNRRSSGRPSDFNEDLEEAIDREFEKDETATYREVADRLNLPPTTLYEHATKKMDYRSLGTAIWPFPSEAYREKRLARLLGNRTCAPSSKSTPPAATASRAATATSQT